MFFNFENLDLYTPYHITVQTENEQVGGFGGGPGVAAEIDCTTDPKGRRLP